MIDTQSRTWQTVKRHLEQRLIACRQKNDRIGLTEAETAALRGEIAAIKNLLDLPKTTAPVEVDDPGYGTNSLDEA
jgi:hypothetical protein